MRGATHAQFERSARYYDAFYRDRDYVADVEALETWIDALSPGAKDLLDVACGSHEHARYFDQRFRVDGLDRNEEFLTAAACKTAYRSRLGWYYAASMDTFDLGKRYNVILCLFSSIAYLPDVKALERTIARFAHHLAPGGLILIEPWLTPENMDHFVPLQQVRDGETHIARRSSYRIDGPRLTLTLRYAVQGGGQDLTFREDHHMRFFDREDFARAFSQAGLTFAQVEPGLSAGRGLYLAVPSSHAQAERVRRLDGVR